MTQLKVAPAGGFASFAVNTIATLGRIMLPPEPEPKPKPKDPGIKITRIPSSAERNEATLMNIRRLIAADRNVISRHPYLRHLFDRYAAVIDDVTVFGHPVSPVEPVRDFVERVNITAEQRRAKDAIKKKAYQARQRKKASERNNNRNGFRDSR